LLIIDFIVILHVRLIRVLLKIHQSINQLFKVIKMSAEIQTQSYYLCGPPDQR